MQAIPPYAKLKNHYFLNLFASRSFEDTKVYLQTSFRPFKLNATNLPKETIEKTSFLLGVKRTKDQTSTQKGFSHSWRSELRYYGALYNSFYYMPGLRYRDPAYNIYSMYANTVGDHLYPLRKFDTPFSQWAMSTEFQWYDVFLANLTGNLQYRFDKKLGAFLDHDLNYIYAISKKTASPHRISYLYPFFDGGFVYTPAPNMQLKASMTNKAMNLDLHYPTHYLLKQPVFQIAMEARFK